VILTPAAHVIVLSYRCSAGGSYGRVVNVARDTGAPNAQIRHPGAVIVAILVNSARGPLGR